MGTRKTTHIRVYKDTAEEVRSRFSKVRMADFFDIAIKTNPALLIEGAMRKKVVKKK